MGVAVRMAVIDRRDTAMLIPYTSINPATLDELLNDFVSRDGTDNGHFTSLEERKAELLSALGREDVFITFNHEYLQPCLVAKHDASTKALSDFAELKKDLSREDEKASFQRQSEAEFYTLFNRLQSNGMLPVTLGRTTQSQAVSRLRQSGAVTLPDLQSMLRRHGNGDFGQITWCEKLSNLNAIAIKQAFFSRYTSPGLVFRVHSLDGYPQTHVSIEGECSL